MRTHQKILGAMAVLILVVQFFLLLGPASPARAGQEEVAMFYDELTRYGNWVDYANYGQVWYPTTVTANWRPYVDGRWVPTEDGWIFETDEPWGWATYHYGNWMPTDDYGWVWAPGSTWYPSTVAWRTSDDYVGWAPIPPPNYTPTPAYYPPGGYSPGAPAVDLISPPFWTFCNAPNFLPGFGLPYSPAYSYYNSGYLYPFSSIPFIYPRTFLLADFFFFPFAPRAFFFFGPRFPFVSRVTNINIININKFVNNVRVNRIRNGLPPRAVLDRRPFLRDAVPRELREGQRLGIRQAADGRQVRGNVARPDAVAAPRRITTRGEGGPEVIRGTRREGGRVEVPRAARGREGRGPDGLRSLPETRGRGATVGDGRRGLGFPPQSVREPREMRDQLRRQRQSDRGFPRAEQQRFRRDEQQIRRQELFRPDRGGGRGRGEMRAPRGAPAPRPQIQRAPAPGRGGGGAPSGFRGGGAPSGGRGGVRAPSGGRGGGAPSGGGGGGRGGGGGGRSGGGGGRGR